jgi:hypothetical protein
VKVSCATTSALTAQHNIEDSGFTPPEKMGSEFIEILEMMSFFCDHKPILVLEWFNGTSWSCF